MFIRALKVSVLPLIAIGSFVAVASAACGGQDSPTATRVPDRVATATSVTETAAATVSGAATAAAPARREPTGDDATPVVRISRPTDPELAAVYDKAVAVLTDRALSHSDRRNKVRLLRKSAGDDKFFAAIQSAPVVDPGTGKSVSFSEYMADLASTYIGHPEAPISFDPVGAATRIYFSPTEKVIREMTGIGLELDRILAAAGTYRGALSEVETLVKAVEAIQVISEVEAVVEAASAPPPAFIEKRRDLKDTYVRARTILTDPSESDDSRRQKLRVLQDDVGDEALTLVLRYVPIIDSETDTVQTFDSYMRELAGDYSSASGSPIERDPVGATMRIFFDPSVETIQAMTGFGLSQNEQRDVSRRYERESVDFGAAVKEIAGRAKSEFDWKDFKSSAADLASSIFSFGD